MNKVKILFIFACVILFAGFVSATPGTDVAYILEDSSQVSLNIVNVIEDLGLSYELVRDSEIPGADFSDYDALIIVEDVNNEDFLPMGEMNAIFLDRDIADNTWTVANTGQIFPAPFVRVSDANSFAFDGVTINDDSEVRVYAGFFDGGVHYLNPPIQSGVTSVGIRTGGGFRPVISHSTEDVNGQLVKSFFYGVPDTTNWNSDGQRIFENGLSWIFSEVDGDNDGFSYGEDCDDGDAEFYPGAPEVPYDGLDQDCDGFDLIDVDGDGYCHDGFAIDNVAAQCPLDNLFFGDDCNDDDFDINPSNPDGALNCVNDAPVFNGEIDDVTWNEDTELVDAIDLNEYFSDVDSSLSYSVSGNSEISITIINGLVSFNPSQDFFGVENVIFIASDGQYSAESNSVALEVIDTGDPPAFDPLDCDTELIEDESYTCEISATDSEGDAFTFSIFDEESLDCGIIGDVLTYKGYDDYFGPASCTLAVTDETGTNTVELAVSIDGVNDAPEFNGEIDDVSWNEDNELVDAIDLNEYFSDVDSTLAFQAFSDSSDIIVTISEGIASFSSSDEFYGSTSVYFEASDGEFNVQSNQLLAIVAPVGDAPVFDELNCETELLEDEEYTCTLSATDTEGNEYSFSVGESDGLECLVSGNVLTYSSEPDYYGNGECELIVSDIHGSSSALLETNIENVNDAPKINSYSPNQNVVSVISGQSQEFSIEATDVDSSYNVIWKIDSEEIEEYSDEDQFLFGGEEGVYFVEAEVSDEEFSLSQIWIVVIGPTTEFACEDIGGSVCTGDSICGGGTVETSNSNSCCTSSCVPKFSDADSCEVIDSRVIVIVDKPEDDELIELGDSVRVEVDLTNNFEDDLDLEVETYLYNLDRDRVETESLTDYKIDSGKTRSVRMDLEIPLDLDLTNSYAIFTRVEDELCSQGFKNIDIERPQDKLYISKIDLPSVAQCGDTIVGEIRVENVGIDEQTDVELELRNRRLAIDETFQFDIDEFDGEDDRFSQNFIFTIPDDTSGREDISIRLLYGDETERDNPVIDVSCSNKPEDEETIVSSGDVDEDSSLVLNGAQELSESSPSTNVGSSRNYTLIAAILMLNLMLVAAVSILYFSHVKRKG